MTHTEAHVRKKQLWTRDFILIWLVNFLLYGGFYLLLPTLPLYVQRLGGTESSVGFVAGIFSVSAMLTRPWVGKTLDFCCQRTILQVSLGLFIAATLGYNWMAAIWAVIAFRLLHGISWSGCTTGAATIAAIVIPGERRGEGMGYYGLAVNIAMIGGPALGLLIVNQYEFQQVFYLAGVSIFLALILTLLIQGKEQVNEQQIPDGFIEPTALPYTVIFAFATVMYGSIVSFVPLFIYQKSLGSPSLFFIVLGVALILSRPVSGKLFDKYGDHIVIVPGLLLMLLAVIMVGSAENTIRVLIGASMMGVGYGAVHPSLQAIVIQRAGAKKRGLATATLLLGSDIGIGIGAMLLGMTAERWGYETMYYIASLAGIAGLFMYGKIKGIFGRKFVA